MLKHFAAVKALAASCVPVAVQVVDSALLDSGGTPIRAQYIMILGGGPDVLNDNRFTAPQRADSDAEYLYTARCVAVTPDGARGLAQKLIDGMVGVTPTVAGRNCQPIILDDSTSVQPDNALKPPLWYLDLDLLLTSSRA